MVCVLAVIINYISCVTFNVHVTPQCPGRAGSTLCIPRVADAVVETHRFYTDRKRKLKGHFICRCCYCCYHVLTMLASCGWIMTFYQISSEIFAGTASLSDCSRNALFVSLQSRMMPWLAPCKVKLCGSMRGRAPEPNYE